MNMSCINIFLMELTFNSLIFTKFIKKNGIEYILINNSKTKKRRRSWKCLNLICFRDGSLEVFIVNCIYIPKTVCIFIPSLSEDSKFISVHRRSLKNDKADDIIPAIFIICGPWNQNYTFTNELKKIYILLSCYSISASSLSSDS